MNYRVYSALVKMASDSQVAARPRADRIQIDGLSPEDNQAANDVVQLGEAITGKTMAGETKHRINEGVSAANQIWQRVKQLKQERAKNRPARSVAPNNPAPPLTPPVKTR